MIRPKVRLAILLVPLVSGLLFILTVERFGSKERAKAAWSPHGTVHYVAPTGDDSNLGTSLTNTCNICSKIAPKPMRSKYRNRLRIAQKANIC